MDDYKKQLQKECPVGGLYCKCCNAYFGKDKKKLNRIARRRLKRKVKKQINTLITE